MSDQGLVDALKEDWRQAALPPREQAICAYADKLTRAPRDVTAADLDDLRRVGLDDRGILDVVQVVGFFNYINRVAEGLGVPPEADWR